MSEIKQASGGDGWSDWRVFRERFGGYAVEVISCTERTADGEPKVIRSEFGIANGRSAIDIACSASSEYAHRMAS